MAAQEPQYSGAKSEVRTSALCLAFLLGGGGGEGGGGLPHLPADVGKPPPQPTVWVCASSPGWRARAAAGGQPISSQPRRPPCSGVPQAGPGATVPVEGSCCSTGPKREKNCLLWQPLLCPSQLPLCCLICSSPRTKEAAGSVGLDATD